MPKTSYSKDLSKILKLINDYSSCSIYGCNNPKLTHLNQDSPEHLRFIPSCLDCDSIKNRGNNLIFKKGSFKKLPHELETKLKRETFLELKNQKNSELFLILVTSSMDIVKIAENNPAFSVIKSDNPKYFHLKKKIISNNITVDFNNNLPIFLDLMNYLYPYVESI